MDENASRAVFLGVSVLVAIITITLIVNFYQTAKDSAAVANRYDITNRYNKNVTDIIAKTTITGSELRYLLNYFEDSEEVDVIVYKSESDKVNGIELEVYEDEYWSDEHQAMLDNIIRPNYNYNLEIDEESAKYKLIASFVY